MYVSKLKAMFVASPASVFTAIATVLRYVSENRVNGGLHKVKHTVLRQKSICKLIIAVFLFCYTVYCPFKRVLLVQHFRLKCALEINTNLQYGNVTTMRNSGKNVGGNVELLKLEQSVLHILYSLSNMATVGTKDMVVHKQRDVNVCISKERSMQENCCYTNMTPWARLHCYIVRPNPISPLAPTA